MTTKELIKQLQKLDPDGNMEVYHWCGNYMEQPTEHVTVEYDCTTDKDYILFD